MTTTLTTEQRTTYEGYLADAEKAYHQLKTGAQAKIVVDQNGERVEFTVARSTELRAYILELKSILGIDPGVIGPLTPWFM